MKKVRPGDILKYAKPGMILYSPAFGDIKFLSVDDLGSGYKATPMIRCKSLGGSEKTFFMDGSLSTHGECILYPGKDKSWPTELPKFTKGEYIQLLCDGEPEPFEVWKVEYRDNDYWYYDKTGRHYMENFLEKSSGERKFQELPDILNINGIAYIRLDVVRKNETKDKPDEENEEIDA